MSRRSQPGSARVLPLDSGSSAAAGPAATQPQRPLWSASLYCASGLCHASLFEGPLAACEGLVRAPFCLGLGALMLVLALLSGDAVARAAALGWLREGALFFAAALTLAVPCAAALTVYRDLWRAGLDGRLQDSYEADDWDLKAIPTVLGAVDPRRFVVFVRGQGSVAGNVQEDAASGRALDGLAECGAAAGAPRDGAAEEEDARLVIPDT